MFQQSGIKGKLIRYADDFVVLLRGDGVRVKLLMGRMLERLGLTMHPEKTRISDARKGFDFLSVHFRVAPVRKRESKMKEVCVLWPSDKAISRARERVQRIIGRRLLNPALFRRSIPTVFLPDNEVVCAPMVVENSKRTGKRLIYGVHAHGSLSRDS